VGSLPNLTGDLLALDLVKANTSGLSVLRNATTSSTRLVVPPLLKWRTFQEAIENAFAKSLSRQTTARQLYATLVT
jgi:hypothetical protein